jgi:hypothetical protein
MRLALVLLVLVVTATTAPADDVRPRGHGTLQPNHQGNARPNRHGGADTGLFIDVPLDYDTRVVFPFGGSHHAVPGVVAINKAPYYCRPHDLAFKARGAFVEHLGVKHGLSDREIPGMVLVEHNQVRYVGD